MSETIDNNIFVLRFKILHEYYKKLFFGSKYDMDKTVNILLKQYNLSVNFLEKNLAYLLANGYLARKEDREVMDFNISYKGVIFVELITEGDIDFKDEKLNGRIPHLIRTFRENDSLES